MSSRTPVFSMLNFRGTSLEQDSRFGDRDKKLAEKIKFPVEFETKVRAAHSMSLRKKNKKFYS
jgi:hypothetical protein